VVPEGRLLIIPDSSAWIEYLRRSGRQADNALDAAVEAGEIIAVTDVTLMEVLAGAKEQERYARFRRLLATFDFVPTESPSDYIAAADLFRQCRAAGVVVRSMTDCLIAAVAIRTGAEVLHQDKDFDALARIAGLRIYPT